jgi:hypothetical protein
MRAGCSWPQQAPSSGHWPCILESVSKLHFSAVVLEPVRTACLSAMKRTLTSPSFEEPTGPPSSGHRSIRWRCCRVPSPPFTVHSMWMQLR